MFKIFYKNVSPLSNNKNNGEDTVNVKCNYVFLKIPSLVNTPKWIWRFVLPDQNKVNIFVRRVIILWNNKIIGYKEWL